MSLNELTTVISTVGFPILAYFYMGKLLKENMDKNTEKISENTQEMKELINKVDELIAFQLEKEERTE